MNEKLKLNIGIVFAIAIVALFVLFTYKYQLTTAQIGNPPGGQVFRQGGNSFGDNAVLGTNDEFNLIFETNGIDRIQIGTDGLVQMANGLLQVLDANRIVQVNGGIIGRPQSDTTAVTISASSVPNFSANLQEWRDEGNRLIGSFGAKSTLQLGTNQSSYVSPFVPGCLIIADSDGQGVTYVTANDGVLTASAIKPSACQ